MPVPPTAAAPAARTRRRWEVDVWRGAAMVLMIVYHGLFDLRLMGVAPDLNVMSGPIRLIQRVCASSFIAVLGVSLWLARRRSFVATARKAALLLGLGLLLGIGARVAGAPSLWFGILSLLGCSMVAGWPLLRLRTGNLPLGAALIAIGVVLHRRFDVGGPWALLVQPTHFQALDHFPVLPWFGIAVAGIGLGALLYPDHASPTTGGRLGLRLPDLSGAPGVRHLAAAGRHTLVVYLVHQPILVGLIWLWTTLR